MFTGIVTGLGTIIERRPVQEQGSQTQGIELLTFAAPGHLAGLELGGSISVNGVCVSAVAIDHDAEEVSVELIPETLRRTTMGQLEIGHAINLERCLPSEARLDGHVVQGHVDGIGALLERDPADGRHRFGLDAELAPYVAEKGSIAVAGVSLTVTGVSEPEEREPWFEVGLIPTTLAETTLGRLEVGSAVNLEVDVLAKYTRRMLGFQSRQPSAGSPPNGGQAVIEQPGTPAPLLDRVELALEHLAAGKPVIVVDDAGRENEGDIIFPAASATPELMAFTIRHSSGVLCAPMSVERAEHLQLPAMVSENQDPKGTAYTISCDAAADRHPQITTGISAADRALTAQLLAEPAAGPEDLTRPGHLFPLVAHPEGVLGRNGHTEAAVDLCALAGTPAVGIIAELTHDDGRMMRLPALRDFADEHGLALISIEDLIVHRGGSVPVSDHSLAERGLTEMRSQETLESLVEPGPVVTLPTDYGTFAAQVWTERRTGHEHMLISAQGNHPMQNGHAPRPLIRMHSECVTGDVFGSHRCDCGTQLISALESIQQTGGHLLYLRGHEGRGIGLANKMRAYKLQEEGVDTVAANEMLGLPAEQRDFTGAAAILYGADITRLQLLTNNPEKVRVLREAGLDVEQVPSTGVVHEANRRYLETKRDRMHHLLDHLGLTPAHDEQGEQHTL